ncbi:segregation and condensation protein A [Geomesophilobacter sediminis]|uniref:Segregation and condensation protein A n=1 Tax=Geomesophilobacter sediminis TaxID=2798584 RepID=A0A8J7SAZ5_9BACT|nr:segregation/condensation protein A [Geomesophilobacter sediminis]MBJ6727536.1 segregation/condensation protein A [Geomesophilobacter sediminis]
MVEQNPQSTLFSDPLEPAYLVNLEAFEGPLDLLLHLIKKNEVDIYNIPIAAITAQYLEYVELMKELNLDVAGEFLVMAATLLQIKSRMLLPPDPDDEEAAEVEDPRAELVRRLLEYQRYREAATTLVSRDLMGRDVFARKFLAPDRAEQEPEQEQIDVELFELVEAFQRVLKRAPVALFHEVEADGISIAERISQVLDLVRVTGSIAFEKLFVETATRPLLIVTFLSVLELCRLKLIKITQVQDLGAIWLVANGEGEGPGDDEELALEGAVVG